jgi:cyclase
VADAEEILNAGAEKISVNSPALIDPDLIDALAARFGSQCVVVGIDSLAASAAAPQERHPGESRGPVKNESPFGPPSYNYSVHQFTGDPNASRSSGRDTLQWVREVQQRGAGEIVLNCMASDGVRRGYDIKQLSAVRKICDVPLVASGGAGTAQHFNDAFQQAGVDAALAASVFHSGNIVIRDLKRELLATGIEVRP